MVLRAMLVEQVVELMVQAQLTDMVQVAAAEHRPQVVLVDLVMKEHSVKAAKVYTAGAAMVEPAVADGTAEAAPTLTVQAMTTKAAVVDLDMYGRVQMHQADTC